MRMKQLSNDNAANRTSYVGYVYNVGEKIYKNNYWDPLLFEIPEKPYPA